MAPSWVMPGLGGSGLGASAARERGVRERRRIVAGSFIFQLRLLGGKGKGAMERKGAGRFLLFQHLSAICILLRWVGFSHLPTLAEVGIMTMETYMVAKLVDSKGRIGLDK